MDSIKRTNADQIWQLDEHIRFRRLFDEGVLIHQDEAEAIVLNDAGMAFLELCDGRRNMTTIIDGMTAQFDVGSYELGVDLEPFIEELEEAGIIRLVVDES